MGRCRQIIFNEQGNPRFISVSGSELVGRAVTPVNEDQKNTFQGPESEESFLSRATAKGCPIPKEDIERIYQALNVAEGVAPPKKPILLVLTGPPGSGKTTIKNTVFDTLGVKKTEYIDADPDKVMVNMTPWKEGDQKVKGECRKWSSYLLNDILLRKFLYSDHHIAYDTTGRDIEQLRTVVKLTKMFDYRVIFVQVYVKKETAIERVAAREGAGAEGGRKVAADIVTKIYNEFASKSETIFNEFLDYETILINNEKQPMIVFTSQVDAQGDRCPKYGPFYFDVTPYCTTERFPKFIRSYTTALKIAEKVFQNMNTNPTRSLMEMMKGEEFIPNELNGPWKVSLDAAQRTLDYIFNTLHHTCYMFAVVKGEKHLMKLEPEGIPRFFDAELKKALESDDDPRWNRFRDKDLRMMQCVLKIKRDDESFSIPYEKWLKSITLPLPDGLFILNLTDAVLLRRDGRLPWEPRPDILRNVAMKPYLPILGGSGSDFCWDIPIPNYDDVMIMLRKLSGKYNETFETEWSKKKPKAVFRGGFTGCGTTSRTNMRLAIAEQLTGDDFDVKLVGEPPKNPRFDPERGFSFMETTAKPTKTLMTKHDQSEYKYIIHVDGNVAAYRLLEFMQMGSVILKVQGEYRVWFEHMLVNQNNIMILPPSTAAVEEAVKWCKRSDAQCEAIGKRAKVLAERLMSKDVMDQTFAQILWKTTELGRLRGGARHKQKYSITRKRTKSKRKTRRVQRR